MIKNVYQKLRQILIENYKFIFFLIAFYFVLVIPLPYYIHTTGGLIDISDKVTIENEYDKSGSINLSYVTEMRGTVLTYLLSYVMPGWDLVNEGNYVASNETYEDVDYRNRMLLEEANANALMVAYKEASKKVEIKASHFYVVYIDPNANTTLKIGDELLSVEGHQITTMQDYINVITGVQTGNKLNVSVKSKDGVISNRTAYVYTYNGRNVTGIITVGQYNYEATPKISFHFKASESGPSGGLMMSLAIYNKLVTEDLTKGRTIVGTGTIDIDGNVGPISGIEYKLKGAVQSKADIFLAPMGDNYKEALELSKKNKYNIKIVGVSTFSDALNYLRSV